MVSVEHTDAKFIHTSTSLYILENSLPYALPCRYLFHGAVRLGTLYLRVDSVNVDTGDIQCTAESDAELDGLLTVFHCERSTYGVANQQVRN